MIYVLIAEHSPDICPTANAKVRDLMVKGAAEMPNLAKHHGVKVLSGPWVNREHVSVLVAESETAEGLDRFLSESGLAQWNRVRVLPSVSLMEDGLKEVQHAKTIF